MIRHKAARQKAHSILEMFHINEPPINVQDVCEKLGFKVAFIDLPDKVSAAIKIEEDKKAIIVNSNHPITRQRFSMSHELGHYLSGHEDFDESKRIYMDPNKKYMNSQYKNEEEADEFAAELLMPEILLKKDILENRLPLSEIARKYQVSEQAMTIQLLNLKLPIIQKKES